MTLATVCLTPHPDAPATSVTALVVEVTPMAQGEWAFTYRLTGTMERIRIPPPGHRGPVDGLWRHTCLEAFLKAGAGPEYYEFNFSPSGAWAAYQFRAYRDGKPWQPPRPPEISLRQDAHSLVLRVRLTGPVMTGPVRLGLSAVIEDQTGDLAYWALRHPPGRPDFHHTDAFALECPPP